MFSSYFVLLVHFWFSFNIFSLALILFQLFVNLFNAWILLLLCF